MSEPMDFKTAVTTCLQKFADFSGRARRSEYWWFVLAIVVANIVASFVHLWLGHIVSLAALIPGIAATTRRLHDIGKSGWWQLVYFIPLIGLLLMIYWGVQPSQQASNEWGEPADQSGGAMPTA
jgi:uncharacterized membrane protein YhaH (DUF805 family)